MYTSFWLLQMCTFFWRSRSTTRRIGCLSQTIQAYPPCRKAQRQRNPCMYLPRIKAGDVLNGWMAKTILLNQSTVSSILEYQVYTSIASSTFFHLSISHRTSSIGETGFNSRNRSFFAPGTRLTDPIGWGSRRFQWVQTDQQHGFEFSLPRAAAEGGKDPWLFLAGMLLLLKPWYG